jgi:hypothetical protein
MSINGLSFEGEGLYFSERYLLPQASCISAMSTRLNAVVFPGLTALGARRFAWLMPGEEFPGMPLRNAFGGMLFEMANDTNCFSFFALQSSDPTGAALVAQTITAGQKPTELPATQPPPSMPDGIPPLFAHEPQNAPAPPPQPQKSSELDWESD